MREEHISDLDLRESIDILERVDALYQSVPIEMIG
jgi:hypothetical protein